MSQEIPGFDRDPELDKLLTSNLEELDEDQRSEVQRYKSQLLKARRDAGMSASKPLWWGDSEAPETLDEASFEGVDMEAAAEAAEPADDEPAQAAEDEADSETAESEEESADESEQTEEPADSSGSDTEDPSEVEIDDDELVEVGFELDEELEGLLEEDIKSIEDEDKRQEIQLYRSRKMQAREELRQDKAGGGSGGDDGSTDTGGPDRDEDSRQAPPPEDISEYSGERKVADLVDDRQSGRDVSRRGFISSLAVGWAGFLSMTALTGATTARFFFPNVLANPPEQFIAGKPDDYPTGTVSEDYISDYRVWIVNLGDRLVSILAICTHLGCTPGWLSSQRIFKCPCHGSGYRMNGVNFEGPAPRPMDRVAIRRSPEGSIIVNKGKTFSQSGTPGWDSQDAYIPV